MKVKVTMEPKQVQRAVERGMVKSLRGAGALIYRIARNSIAFRKSRDLHSKPGKAPFTHDRALKRSIRFTVENNSVVIGPTRTEIGTIGQLHEFGGSVHRNSKERKYRPNNWVIKPGGHGPIDIKGGQVKFGKLHTEKQIYRAKILSFQALIALGVDQNEARKIQNTFGSPEKQERTYPARPFMGPALDIACPRLPEAWRNSIRN